MRILEFYKRFPDEQSCKQEFIQYRLNEGVKCKRCSSFDHYREKKREQWECKRCGFRTMSCTKKSFSSKEIQRELGHKRYQPIWEMAHRIRSVMGLRDDCYILGNEIELDDGFFETVDIRRDPNEPLKRGRGSQRQTTVLVMAESQEVESTKLDKKYAHKKKLGFLKMIVITRGFSRNVIYTRSK